MSRISFYQCQQSHLTFMREPWPTDWKISGYITCPVCRHKANLEGHPPGIQERQDLVTMEWFIPHTLNQYRDALDENFPKTLFTIGQARSHYESGQLTKKMFYRKIKN
jgi:hypothetical protein